MKFLTLKNALVVMCVSATVACDRLDKAIEQAQTKAEQSSTPAPAVDPSNGKPEPGKIDPSNGDAQTPPPKDQPGQEPDQVCTAMAAAGLVVLVSDKATGKALEAEVKAVSSDGSYTEKIYAIPTLLPVEGNTAPAQYQGLYERPGKYVVTVKKSGFADFVASDVEVVKAGCHVKMVTVNAQLVKLDGSQQAPNTQSSDQQKKVSDLVLAQARQEKAANGLELKVTEIKQMKFSNGCLEIQKPGEVCTTALVDGWRVVVTGKRPSSQMGIPYSTTWVYHTNLDGSAIRLKEMTQAQ